LIPVISAVTNTDLTNSGGGQEATILPETQFRVFRKQPHYLGIAAPYRRILARTPGAALVFLDLVRPAIAGLRESNDLRVVRRVGTVQTRRVA